MYKPKEIEKVLLNAASLRKRISALGKEITGDYSGRNLVLVSILKGSIVFLSELIRNIRLPLEVDFIAASSYGKKTETTGVVRLIMDLRESIQGKDVIIVDDIIDTGLTMAYLARNLETRRPKSLKICTLLDKPSNRKIKIEPDYSGFRIPDRFVVGFGLDYAEKYRNLPYVGILRPVKGKKYE